MPRRHKIFAVLTGAVLLLNVMTGFAQERAPPAPDQINGPVKTGKERLSNKASDEQRDDNCKVPQEKWGTKPRPSACRQAVVAIPAD